MRQQRRQQVPKSKSRKRRTIKPPKIKKDASGWYIYPNGARRKKHWYIKQYITGWYVWRELDDTWGPYKSLEECLQKRKKLLAKGWSR